MSSCVIITPVIFISLIHTIFLRSTNHWLTLCIFLETVWWHFDLSMNVHFACVRACVRVCSRNAFWQFSPWSEKRQKSYLFSSFGIEAPKGANGSEVELQMWRQRWIGVTSTQQKFGSCKNLLYSMIPDVFTVPAKSARVGFEIHKRLRLSVLVRVVILY